MLQILGITFREPATRKYGTALVEDGRHTHRT